MISSIEPVRWRTVLQVWGKSYSLVLKEIKIEQIFGDF